MPMENHLSPDALAELALSDAEEPPHVAGCASCRADLDALRRIAADLRTVPDAPPELVEAAKAYFRRRRRLDGLIERLIEDPALRAKAAARPADVLSEAGLDPTPELIEALRESGRSSGDLAKRLAAKGWL
jgi:hypothetical protein